MINLQKQVHEKGTFQDVHINIKKNLSPIFIKLNKKKLRKNYIIQKEDDLRLVEKFTA